MTPYLEEIKQPRPTATDVVTGQKRPQTTPLRSPRQPVQLTLWPECQVCGQFEPMCQCQKEGAK
jgi:hypothetical protein